MVGRDNIKNTIEIEVWPPGDIRRPNNTVLVERPMRPVGTGDLDIVWIFLIISSEGAHRISALCVYPHN